MSKPSIAFQTFGCKLNFSETSTISRIFQKNGYHTVDHKDIADIYVIHSCSVTGHAEKKCRAAIRQARKRNPQARIAIIGCFSQLRPEELSRFEEVDLVLGNNEKYQLYDYLEELLHSRKLPKDKWIAGNIAAMHEFYPAYSAGDRTRAFLKIQDGCDYFCAYCTIPLARGRSRSNSIKQTLELAREAAATEAREIILTGVNIGDFGKRQGESLLDLMQELDRIDGIDRIRLSSIEPDLLSDEIISFVSEAGKFLPHFHIPLQSGSNKILGLMNRKYDVSLFDDRVRKIKSLMPAACIAADVIVGFPGESSRDFEETFTYVRNAPLSYVHVFTYSDRPGTKASLMERKVSPPESKRRSEILHRLSDEKKLRFYTEHQGREANVLFESDNHAGHIQGWTENYLRAKTSFDPDLVNEIVRVRLDELGDDHVFTCEIIDKTS